MDGQQSAGGFGQQNYEMHSKLNKPGQGREVRK